MSFPESTPNLLCRLVLVAVLIVSIVYVLVPNLPPTMTLTLSIPLDNPIFSAFDPSKVALLVESRPLSILAPLLLHFISVVPPDWHFRFMGSPESLAAINASSAIRQHVLDGKLELNVIPPNMSTQGQEMISRFFTTLWLYETVLQPAEWLLVFQTDSIVCANSKKSLDDFLEYDWIGAPWDPNSSWGGNGGLSLRRVSRIIDILRNEERPFDSEPEDVWISERLARHPKAKVANGTVSLEFSGELHSGAGEHVKAGGKGIDDWREGFYEPLGYHTGGGGVWLHGPIWGSPELRQHIWSYCPEVPEGLNDD
ncbi:hypothetical protein FALBO_3151 [Fusarium albosuccineum]|uniref:DUF5672 domain-containing protein n=1 Tax=Fusarium albosuccineum TaxID=1237068 RepID=A0A8H4PBY0_9HYPO|nr:hypothetical protein FALBO_3151 [Fusarium albosuccineum]